MLIFWILIFIVSLALLVKSADWLVESSEKIGLALKISPFIIGVTIVSIGTSFPELASSIAAVLKGATEIVAANVVGSNIANILLIVGLSAITARTLLVKRSLIDLDAPLLATTTGLFIFISWDGKIVFGEGILLLLAFVIYFLYTIFQRREEIITPELVEVLPEGMEVKVLSSRVERRRKEIKEKPTKLNFKVFLFLIFGIIGLVIGANYTIESVLKISEFLKIPTTLIAITAIAFGTSLPELVVSVRAAIKKKYEIALGNIFGSNVFNILIVAGIPALIKPLAIDELTFSVGLPFLVIATLLFIIAGISRRIHIWEGAMYLLIYILFVVKLLNLF
ncbi:MAG TPA: calcium/sodium antiporter [Candidatus Vogelbacteria bacterium]|nr:calcium/sodium antiporter [Candidatus Vogelbacteria bacterium]